MSEHTTPLGAGALRAIAARLASADELAGSSRSLSTIAAASVLHAGLVAGLCEAAGATPLVVVTATLTDAERVAGDLTAFLEPTTGAPAGAPSGAVAVLPAWDTLPLERISPDVATMGQRSALIWALETNDAYTPKVIVAPVRALLQRLVPTTGLEPLELSLGESIDEHELLERLVALGYRREHQVEHRGEFAVRGGIVDVFCSTAILPIRIDLFGDEVDRLTRFEVGDQRSVEEVDVVRIHPARELVLSQDVRARAEALRDTAGFAPELFDRIAAGQYVDGMESLLPWLAPTSQLVLDLFGDRGQIVLLDPRRIVDRARDLADEEHAMLSTLVESWGVPTSGDDSLATLSLHLPFARMLEQTSAPVVSVPALTDAPSDGGIETRRLNPVVGDSERLGAEIAGLIDASMSVVICASTAATARRLAGILREQRLDLTELDHATGRPGLEVVVAPLSTGFIAPALKLAVISESDITGRRTAHRVARARTKSVDGFFDDLAIGSYVVHRTHGIARFVGVTTRTMAGTSRDYLVLEFKGTDRIYLPTDQIELITPYSGGDAPSLSKMGGGDWTRTRAKAKAVASAIADELVELYRQRAQAVGFAFSPDTPWQREVESLFPFTETPDQLEAIEAVKADMEQPRPMDRLVCADVGFGKTEIATRAVFKCVQDNKQAAVLVPTTLLASQHFATLTDRYAGFPVKVALLSRFLTDGEAKEVRAGLADGAIDVVVGTHRLLSEGISFKDLGLLVVDEEQRFGVTHKEAIKALSTDVDVLTLSASPIPRTLEMALTGIRDLSMVTTPPTERRPILTYVGEYDEGAVREAIRRELLREGQVFFVHNRVQDIDERAERIRALVPEARVAVGHGQMDEGTLEQLMLDFADGAYDVLVCTTIVESGIDLPSVNTLICDRADLLGLGQLHQLRGRVGRSNVRAYAYLFHPQDRVLSKTAYERLRTIGEHNELGSGFKIAMRDLEIRGAGNLLGSDQSGFIAAVGYDLYVQLVAEAVAEARGEVIAAPSLVSIDVPGDASLPVTYVAADDARLEAYRRIAAAVTPSDVDDIATEWLDRYGPVPESARGLLAVARLRVEALRVGATDVSATIPRGARRCEVTIKGLTLAASAQVRLRRLHPGATYRESDGLVQLSLTITTKVADALGDLLIALVPPEPTVGVG